MAHKSNHPCQPGSGPDSRRRMAEQSTLRKLVGGWVRRLRRGLGLLLFALLTIWLPKFLSWAWQQFAGTWFVDYATAWWRDWSVAHPWVGQMLTACWAWVVAHPILLTLIIVPLLYMAITLEAARRDLFKAPPEPIADDIDSQAPWWRWFRRKPRERYVTGEDQGYLDHYVNFTAAVGHMSETLDRTCRDHEKIRDRFAQVVQRIDAGGLSIQQIHVVLVRASRDVPPLTHVLEDHLPEYVTASEMFAKSVGGVAAHHLLSTNDQEALGRLVVKFRELLATQQRYRHKLSAFPLASRDLNRAAGELATVIAKEGAATERAVQACEEALARLRTSPEPEPS